MKRLLKIISNIRVGKPDVAPDAPSHVSGVRQGNEPGSIEKDDGLYEKPDPTVSSRSARDRVNMVVATARRSTGINSEDRDPIDPRMPNLPPA